MKISYNWNAQFYWWRYISEAKDTFYFRPDIFIKVPSKLFITFTNNIIYFI